MGPHYGFAVWVENNLGRGATPASLKRYFDPLGIVLSREKWRHLLQGPPKRPDLFLWAAICEATEERLSTFIDYEPTGVMPLRSMRVQSITAKPKLDSATPPPPDPWRHFGGRNDG